MHTGFTLTQVILHQSIMMDFDTAMTKVYFYPPHLDQNIHSPDFYLIVTKTKLTEGEEIRVQDGLILSEHSLRLLDAQNFMTKEIDVLELFQEKDELVEGIAYSVSNVLANGATIYDDTMRSSDIYQLFEESPVLFGSEWIQTV